MTSLKAFRFPQDVEPEEKPTKTAHKESRHERASDDAMLTFVFESSAMLSSQFVTHFLCIFIYIYTYIGYVYMWSPHVTAI